jgi:hypothetical protein
MRAVGYEPRSETLEIEFHNDHVYRYFGVPAAVYLKLLNARSLGTYFNEHVRDEFQARQVT